eukprot:336474-Chlamydomonas_euryale.AAC.3
MIPSVPRHVAGKSPAPGWPAPGWPGAPQLLPHCLPHCQLAEQPSPGKRGRNGNVSGIPPRKYEIAGRLPEPSDRVCHRGVGPMKTAPEWHNECQTCQQNNCRTFANRAAAGTAQDGCLRAQV